MLYFFIEIYMENKNNLDDQNTQQIGQNKVNPPTQIPEKLKVNYWMISTFALIAVLIAFAGYYIFSFQKPKEDIGKRNNFSPSTIPTQKPSQIPTPVTTDKNEQNVVFLGDYNNQLFLKYNGKIYNDSDQYDLKTVTVDPNSVNWMKVIEGPINPKGYNEPFSFMVFPGNKKAIVVMRWSRGDSDPETISEYAIYKVFIYDTVNQKTNEIKELGQSSNEKNYNVPKVNQISNDGQFISFNMFGCWNCGGHKPETLLYDTIQNKTKRIGKALDFKWLNGGSYQYKEYKVKPCAEPQPGECFEEASTLSYITSSF